MIKDFKHKGLERFFLTGSKAGIQAATSSKLQVADRAQAIVKARDAGLQ